MSGRRYSKSFEITLSALACAVAVVFLYLGTINDYMLFIGYVIAEVALMLPLSREFYGGAALAYIGCCLLTIILGAVSRIWTLVPFIVFFGLHPIANALQIRFKINRWIALAVKTVWFDLTCWLALYVVFGGVLGGDSEFFEILNEYIWLVIIVGGSVFAFIYDYAMFRCRDMVNALVFRIKK